MALKHMSGWNVRRLMRLHKVSIRDLAARMSITMKRVRQVRSEGVAGELMCLDWYEAIACVGVFERFKHGASQVEGVANNG